VTQKILASAVRIAAGQQDKLYLGNIDIQRDWGWAEDYVETMYLMLQQEQSDDYVIATGESYKLAEIYPPPFGYPSLEGIYRCVSARGVGLAGVCGSVTRGYVGRQIWLGQIVQSIIWRFDTSSKSRRLRVAMGRFNDKAIAAIRISF
jgi:hypothetical protein